MENLTQLCKDLEHFETPEWAVKAILKKEILTPFVIDPCCGAGALVWPLECAGYEVFREDIHDWGFPETLVRDFLTRTIDNDLSGLTVFMNPPFSKAVEFVEKSFELGARKIVCFQRFAWWESRKRRAFWRARPPQRIYICGDRADCWRHDIPDDQRGSSTPTAHAWFVWERGCPAGTLLSHIYKDDV